MKAQLSKLVLASLALLSLNAVAITHYVDLNSPSPTPPYTSWATAATNIQDAIDAAVNGDLVLVTNGVYASSGRVIYGAVTNRVAVTKAIKVQSVNGSEVTIIRGNRVLGNTAVRCVYLSSNAVLSGFTLTNGATRNLGDENIERSGGAIWCESTNAFVFDCVMTGNSAGHGGGGVFSGTLSNCLISANSALTGGGVYLGNLISCSISGNSTPLGDWYYYGGGARECFLYDCTLSGNVAPVGGGGAYACTLVSCRLLNNAANSVTGFGGGGALSSSLTNCLVSGNSATAQGGGAAYSRLTNCVISGNQSGAGGGTYSGTSVNCYYTENSNNRGGADYRGSLINCVLRRNHAIDGGGAYQSGLLNCTVIENDAHYGGGVISCSLINCIVYNNTSRVEDPNYSGGTLNYCCTTPTPSGGVGNISSDPLFVNPVAGDYRLQTNSPCVEGGNNAYVSVTSDYAGNPRIIGANVDMGAIEFQFPTCLALQPQSQTVFGEYPAAFNALAVSPLPFKYQWQFNGAIIVGATNSTLAINFAQQTNAGNYCVVVSNALVTINSSNAVLTVDFPVPTLISQPTNLVAILTSNASFAVSASNLYPIRFQWQRNGTNLTNGAKFSGVTNSTLTVSNLQFSDEATYQVIVSNKYNSVTSSPALLTVLGAPSILQAPSDLVAMTHTAQAISVTVTGAPALFFQWQKDNINLTNGPRIAGANSSALTLLDPVTLDSGNYRVVITNAFGTTTTTNARLTVVPFVSWGYATKVPPANATNVIGLAAGANGGDFDVVLRGDGTVVQWGLNSTIPPEATNLTAIAAGMYYVMGLRRDGVVIVWGETNVNGLAGMPVPTSATNIVSVAAGFYHCLALRRDGTVVGWGNNDYGEAAPPSDATNIIAISAGDRFSLALRQDGAVIGWGGNFYGQTTPPSLVTNIVAIAAGAGQCSGLQENGNVLGWGKNYFGEAVPPPNATNVIAIASGNGNLALRQDGTLVNWPSDPVFPTLTDATLISLRDSHGLALVRDPLTQVAPNIFGSLSDRAAFIGQTTVFSPHVTGSGPLGYRWFFNNTPIAGQTNSWLAVTAMQTNQAGNYHLVVANASGTATSEVATVLVLPQATIAAQPVSRSVVLGSNVTFSISMFGQPQFSYQWYFGEVPLSDGSFVTGSTNDTLHISTVQITNGGSYSVVVSNSFNSSTSQLASLTVLIPVGITAQPTNQNILVGSNAAFTVTATGDAPISYEWRKNGVWLPNGGRISGVNTPTLVITGGQTNDAGDFQVVVANSYGICTSSVATLSVYIPAQIITQPESIAVMQGSNAQFTVASTGTALGYQWLFNGNPLLDDARISGTTTPGLTISNVQSSDVGGYHVVVSNLLSAISSSVASLTPLSNAASSIRYVNLNSITPAPPYLDWATAASTIQDAISASVAGDLILVTNGVYQSGGRVVYGSLTNRVAVNKAVTVQSVNGPGSTFIQGNRGIGNSAVRCVYLTNNATLVGFTLTNGATRNSGDAIKEQSGGGAWCESTNSALLNCLLVSNSVAQLGGGVFSGTSSNCTFVFNFATNGGAAFGGVLNNCVLSTNSAINGGASCSNTLNFCSLIANKATGFGAGAYGSFLNACVIAENTNSNQGAGIHSSAAIDCTISNNISSANFGGGAYASSLTNCAILGNTANRGGGVYTCIVKNSQLVGNRATDGTGGAGAFQSTLYNSLVAGNRAALGTGGGGYGCTFDNCLVSSNSAAGAGVGAYNSTLNNCTVVGHTNNYGVYASTLKNSIVYYNAANYFSGSLINCCATPLPSGQGSFTNAPRFLNLLAGNFWLQSDSPCINAGNNSYATNVFDLDGGPRFFLGTVDVGAYEFRGQDNGSFADWLQKYGLSSDGSNDFTDADADGANNWQEWRADTIPTNSQSVFSLFNPVRGPAGFVVTWQSQNTRTYFLERSTNLTAHPRFLMLATNIAGQPGLTSYAVTNVVGVGSVFYRVGVQVQAGVSVISYAWLQRYGLPTDGSADFSDADGDGMNNWKEWRADTVPTNALSALRMVNATNSPTGAKVTWQSVVTRSYWLERATNLDLASPFQIVGTNIAGAAGQKTYTDPTATNGGPYFYRVGVQ